MAFLPAILAAASATPAAPNLSPQLSGQLSTVSDTLTGKTIAIAKLGDLASGFAVNLAISLLILLSTLWLAKWASRLAGAAFSRVPGAHRDATLRDFIASLVRYALILIGGIAILNRLGFQTTSIITVLGAASLAVGLALQGALSNLAAGVMVLIFRPFRVGDVVTIAGKTGTVKHLDLFNTEIADGDGLKVVVPNGKAFGDVITNYTDIPNRRMELSFRVPFEADTDKAIATVLETARADKRLSETPAPWCRVTDIQPDALLVTLRAWSDLPAYWDVRFDLLKRIPQALRHAGIPTAYPTSASAPPPDETPKPRLTDAA